MTVGSGLVMAAAVVVLALSPLLAGQPGEQAPGAHPARDGR